MKRFFAFIIAFIILQAQTVTLSSTVSDEELISASYKWQSLPIGAGGFVTGIVFHPLDEDLIYIRTDVGGIYRWDKTNESWLPLCDVFGISESNLYGIDGIAVDPQNPDVVYIAAGKYLWGNPSGIYKSSNRGKSWVQKKSGLQFNANGANRAYGECIAVDPVNSSIIYCGTRYQGLWRSADGAETWENIGAGEFQKGTYDNPVAIRNIVFDKSSAKNGKCMVIYVGELGVGLHRSIDGGETWELIPNSPKTISRMEVSDTGALYAASSQGVFKFKENTWSDISPSQVVPSAEGGYSGVNIHPTDENTLVCVYAAKHADMKMHFYYTTDGGETWVDKWQTSDYTPTLPWLDTRWGDFSSNTADIKMNPHNPSQVFFTDYGGVFRTNDITEEPRQKWTNPIHGIEEIVPLDAVAPPTGKYRLLTGVADCDGMPYENLTDYPKRMLSGHKRPSPWMMSTAQLDFCEEDPNIVVRAGVDYNYWVGRIEVSLDGSETWVDRTPKDGSGNKTQCLRIAISSQKHPTTGKPTIVALQLGRPPLFSDDLGITWTEVSGITDTNIVYALWSDTTYLKPLASDRVNGNKFYIHGTDKNIYVSEDWGKTWTKTASISRSANSTLKTAPDMADEVWVGGNNSVGLYRSSDGGKNFAKLTNVSNVISFGFGKAAPGKTNPAIFLLGSVSGSEGMYRSLDMGATWKRINDRYSKLGNEPNVVEGDRQHFGVVYVGTDGRGFYYGEPDVLSDFTTAEHKYFKETFENYDVDTKNNFNQENGWAIEYKNNSGTVLTNDNTYVMAVQDPDLSNSNNKAGLFYDGHNGNVANSNIYAGLSFNRITGEKTNNLATVQLKWRQEYDSKNAAVSLWDNDKKIVSFACSPGYNNGLGLTMPLNVAGGAAVASAFQWNYDSKWHTIRLELDFDLQTIDAYYDDTLKLTGYFIDSNAVGIDNIRFNTSNDSNSIIYLDDIYVVDGRNISIADAPVDYDVVDGSASYEVNGESITVTADIIKGKGDAIVIAAAYNANDELIGISEIAFLNDETLLTKWITSYKKTFAVHESAEAVRIHIWNSMGNIKPLCKFTKKITAH